MATTSSVLYASDALHLPPFEGQKRARAHERAGERVRVCFGMCSCLRHAPQTCACAQNCAFLCVERNKTHGATLNMHVRAPVHIDIHIQRVIHTDGDGVASSVSSRLGPSFLDFSQPRPSHLVFVVVDRLRVPFAHCPQSKVLGGRDDGGLPTFASPWNDVLTRAIVHVHLQTGSETDLQRRVDQYCIS